MSLAHALLMAELLLKAIDNKNPSEPNPHTLGLTTQEPSPMDDQTTTPAPDATADATSETPTTDAPATSRATPSAESANLSDVQTLIGEITQLVQILDKNPDMFTFLRALMAK